MILLSRPSQQQVAEFAASQIGRPYSYKEVGMSANLVQDDSVAKHLEQDLGYKLDHNRIHLGEGRATFERAVAEFKKWHQFDLKWMEVCTADVPIAADSVVCLLVSFTPLRMLFACRIVYIIGDAVDELVDDESPIKKFGFGYGTLAGHPESGEERFLIEWHRQDDSVWYDILAFSRPGTLLTQIGYPFARLMQRRFARDSKSVLKSCTCD